MSTTSGHPLKIKRQTPVHLTAVKQISWPSFQGNDQLVGRSPSGKATIWADASMSSMGFQNAQDLIAQADQILAFNDSIFGTPSGPVNVIIFPLGGATDGTGGADHMGCDFVTGKDIEVCASYGNSDRCFGLFEAELSECSMNGALCGLSTGEALSRWCANIVSNNALADFASAPTWMQNGMPNFVDVVDPTDQNYDSTGCGMAFISWLLSLGFQLPGIAAAMVSLGDRGTLAQLYAKLTGTSDTAAVWPAFQHAIAILPNVVHNDDPFASQPPFQPPVQPSAQQQQHHHHHRK